QSAEEEKRSPVLWYGRLVDFGNFGTVVNRHASSREIEFSFKLTLPKSHSYGGRLAYYYGESDEALIAEEAELTATIRLEQKDKAKPSYASYIRLELFGNVCEIKFSDSQRLLELQVNELRWVLGEQQNTLVRVNQQRIFPGLQFLRQLTRKTEHGEQKYLIKLDPFRTGLREALYAAAANRHMSSETIDQILSVIPIGSDTEMIKALQAIPFATKPFHAKASKLKPEDATFIDLRDRLFMRALPQLLSDLDKELNSSLSGVRYIEPLRATAQRYYRTQELAVDELDSKGTNVAMFIDSLSDGERGRLNNWLDEHFSIRLKAHNEGGHVALELLQSNSSIGTNLADLGFGFSQLLPIVLQLWDASQARRSKARRTRAGNTSIVVVEQPELHLHPAYQAQVADVIVAALDAAKEQGREISVIAETHSPHLINRLGELVEAGKLSKNDVQVVLFEDSDVLGETNVRPTGFDSDGVLINWPYGFFEPGN
ncbi:MAG: AAA family ATPase, partial [Candidatus Obscuribacterales bacterium]|nr:AAA family ATPase [Candidatus Obscuribacterales bacterium]